VCFLVAIAPQSRGPRRNELKISENALGAYLGYGAAAKVLEGAIKRGAGDSIRAVIWVSDLRNFTKMSMFWRRPTC
jgi:adenylate cyclase